MAITTTHIASWGIRSVHTGISVLAANEGQNCVITAWDSNIEPTMAPETNQVGSVIGQAVYDVTTTVRCSMNAQGSLATAIEAYEKDPSSFCAVVTVDGTTYYCKSIEIVESNQDYIKFNAVLERHKHDITPWDASVYGS